VRGDVILITGGAGAIGAAVGRRLLAEGNRIVLADIRTDAGLALLDQLDQDVAAFSTLDVRNRTEWVAVIAETRRRFGAPTVLVNCAGTTCVGPLETLSLDELVDVTSVNHYGVILGMQAVFSGMRDSGGGSIVNLSSISATFGVGYNAAYAGAKAAVHAVGKAAAVEWAQHGIRVNAVVAGAIDSPMSAGGNYAALGNLQARVAENVPLRRAGTTEEVASLVAFLASDAGAYCTGAEFVIDGGWTAGRLRALAGMSSTP
jgi:3alpha(or 20beta)-hydroxysteroid dehydrogenase